ncbi:MAG: M48 family metallopeptidase [Gaiellales bacterium]
MTLQEQIRANRWRTLLVYVMFAILAAALAVVLGLAFGTGYLLFFGVFAIGYGIFSWFGAGRVIATAAGAVPVDPKQYPEAAGALETVAIGAGLPRTPPLYLINDPAPNAFAAGRDAEHAYVAVTTGLLDTMPRRELEAVLAHEVSHVRNHDVRLMSLAAVLVGVIALVSDLALKFTLFGGAGRGRRDNNGGGNAFILIGVLAAAILAPIAATLLQFALSRRREYQADASAAEITGDAEGMALALERLLVDTKVTTRITNATAHLYIESPTNQRTHQHFAGLWNTHPSLESRIQRLEQAGGFTTPPLTDRAPVGSRPAGAA